MTDKIKLSKNIRFLAALVMTVLIVFAFTACSDDDFEGTRTARILFDSSDRPQWPFYVLVAVVIALVVVHKTYGVFLYEEYNTQLLNVLGCFMIFIVFLYITGSLISGHSIYRESRGLQMFGDWGWFSYYDADRNMHSIFALAQRVLALLSPLMFLYFIHKLIKTRSFIHSLLPVLYLTVAALVTVMAAEIFIIFVGTVIVLVVVFGYVFSGAAFSDSGGGKGAQWNTTCPRCGASVSVGNSCNCGFVK